jgi:RNA polymerase sigma factor (TIGR02999 family)
MVRSNRHVNRILSRTPAIGSFTVMSKPAPSYLTALLAELRRGEVNAREEFVTLVYPELRRIAAAFLRKERHGHTSRPTGLVHEVYLRLFGRGDIDWQNRAHFFAAVAREMRHLLVDHARARNAIKRGEGNIRVSLSELHAASDVRDNDLLAMDEALARLEAIDPRASRVVELRFFTGLSERETADALNISLSTLKRDWNFAKAWLFDQIGPLGVN